MSNGPSRPSIELDTSSRVRNAGGEEDPTSTRKQWSSCDFCRKRKKKCDAHKKATDTVETCSRCLEHGLECTFDFVSQKSVLQNARKRQILATKQTRRLASSNSRNQQCCSAGNGLHQDRVSHESPANDDRNTASPIDNGGLNRVFRPLVPTTYNTPDPTSELQAASMGFIQEAVRSDYIDAPLIHELTGPFTSSPDASKASTPNNAWTTYPEEQMIVNNISSASGLSYELEFEMLRDFALLGLRQMPVVDMDVVFLRYRFGMPTPLPKYLVLAMVACGASYSCQRVIPGIGRDLAKMLFELAKQELTRAAVKETCVDMISALMLVSFHWQGDLTQVERSALLILSVQKIQKLGLHKESNLNRGRTTREAGLIKYLVWLNYIVDAFATTQDLMPGFSKDATAPYNGKEIELNHVNAEEMEFMTKDYLTGIPRSTLTTEAILLNIQFNKAFGGLAKLQNKTVKLQRQLQPVQHLTRDLEDWAVRFFWQFDMCTTLLSWEIAPDSIKGLSFGITSLNFAYWYCALNIHFDGLAADLDTDNYHIRAVHTPPPPRQALPEANILGCFQAFNALITLFERLTADQRIFETAQLVRANLYFGGRILQIFYRNHVRYKGNLVVGELLLQRWETCLSISEVVWGPNSRTPDLSRMSLQEVF